MADAVRLYTNMVVQVRRWLADSDSDEEEMDKSMSQKNECSRAAGEPLGPRTGQVRRRPRSSQAAQRPSPASCPQLEGDGSGCGDSQPTHAASEMVASAKTQKSVMEDAVVDEICHSFSSLALSSSSDNSSASCVTSIRTAIRSAPVKASAALEASQLTSRIHTNYGNQWTDDAAHRSYTSEEAPTQPNKNEPIQKESSHSKSSDLAMKKITKSLMSTWEAISTAISSGNTNINSVSALRESLKSQLSEERSLERKENALSFYSKPKKGPGSLLSGDSYETTEIANKVAELKENTKRISEKRSGRKGNKIGAREGSADSNSSILSGSYPSKFWTKARKNWALTLTRAHDSSTRRLYQDNACNTNCLKRIYLGKRRDLAEGKWGRKYFLTNSKISNASEEVSTSDVASSILEESNLVNSSLESRGSQRAKEPVIERPQFENNRSTNRDRLKEKKELKDETLKLGNFCRMCHRDLSKPISKQLPNRNDRTRLHRKSAEKIVSPSSTMRYSEDHSIASTIRSTFDCLNLSDSNEVCTESRQSSITISLKKCSSKILLGEFCSCPTLPSQISNLFPEMTDVEMVTKEVFETGMSFAPTNQLETLYEETSCDNKLDVHLSKATNKKNNDKPPSDQKNDSLCSSWTDTTSEPPSQYSEKRGRAWSEPGALDSVARRLVAVALGAAAAAAAARRAGRRPLSKERALLEWASALTPLWQRRLRRGGGVGSCGGGGCGGGAACALCVPCVACGACSHCGACMACGAPRKPSLK